RQRLGVVLRLVRLRLLPARPEDEPAGRPARVRAGAAGRLVVQRRPRLPLGAEALRQPLLQPLPRRQHRLPAGAVVPRAGAEAAAPGAPQGLAAAAGGMVRWPREVRDRPFGPGRGTTRCLCSPRRPATVRSSTRKATGCPWPTTASSSGGSSCCTATSPASSATAPTSS